MSRKATTRCASPKLSELVKSNPLGDANTHLPVCRAAAGRAELSRFAGCRSAEIDLLIQRNRVPVGVLHEAMQGVLASKARLFVPAESLVRRVLVNLIQPDRSGLELAPDSLYCRSVFAPHRCPQAIGCVVSSRNDICFAFPLQQRQDRTVSASEPAQQA